MAQLEWHDAPDKASSKPHLSAPKSDPWFGITMGLVGVIVGYLIGNF